MPYEPGGLADRPPEDPAEITRRNQASRTVRYEALARRVAPRLLAIGVLLLLVLIGGLGVLFVVLGIGRLLDPTDSVGEPLGAPMALFDGFAVIFGAAMAIFSIWLIRDLVRRR